MRREVKCGSSRSLYGYDVYMDVIFTRDHEASMCVGEGRFEAAARCL